MSGRGDLDPAPGLWVRAFARLASWMLPADGALPAAAKLRRVLVVRTDDRVGNALLTVPLARALATLLPEARIDLLLASKRAAVAQGLPGITVVPFDKRDAFRSPLRFLRFLWRLRAEGYELVIDAAHWHAYSLTSALLSRVATKRAVLGPARGPRSLYTHLAPLPPPGTQEVRAKVGALGTLGLAVPERVALETGLGLGAEAQAEAGRALEALGLDRFVLLNPGARKADHRLAPEAYAAIARGLHEALGVKVLLTWGPGEEALVEAVRAGAAEATVLAPPTGLDALAALLRRCEVAITNDTGPMHLAVACGAKVVAIFLREDEARWGHPGERFRGVEGVEAAVAAAVALVRGPSRS